MVDVSSEEQALLNGIIACPEDDVPRLVYADWLEERDQPERAEFICVQCELASCQWQGDLIEPRGHALIRRENSLFRQVVRPDLPLAMNLYTMTYIRDGSGPKSPFIIYDRGFVSRVRVPSLADWMGEECEICEGVGDTLVQTDYGSTQEKCLTCNGSGTIEGIGPQLCESNPIEWVGVGDREPLGMSFTNGPQWFWHFTENWPLSRNCLPVGFRDFLHGNGHYYASVEDANAALSRALILWARSTLLAKKKAEELKDKRPWHTSWYDDDIYAEKDDPESNLPTAILTLLDGYLGPGLVMKEYRDDAEAVAALQRAIWQWAKNQVLNAGKMR